MKSDMFNKSLLGGLAAAACLATVSGSALAAENYSNIVVSATCELAARDADGLFDDMLVYVSYEQSNEVAPEITGLTVALEGNLYQDTGKNKDKGKTEWKFIDAASGAWVAGEPVVIANLCASGTDGSSTDWSLYNSLRAEATLAVSNANLGGKGKNATAKDGTFSGRCISIPPPVCN